jgi:hypothetical protein
VVVSYSLRFGYFLITLWGWLALDSEPESACASLAAAVVLAADFLTMIYTLL